MDWFSYEWQIENDHALFTVDMDHGETAPYSDRPVLMHFRMEMSDKSVLNAKALRHIKRLQRKMELPKTLHVGTIEDEYRHVMFFYADDQKRMRELADLADGEKYLYCEPGCSMDDQWNTYFTLLYPDAAKLHTETNRKNIELYRKNKDCITAVRRVTFHVYFPAELYVSQFSEEARLMGFAIGGTEFSPELREPYGVKLQRISSLEKGQLDPLTTAIVYTADKYLGRLIYWESPILPKNSPLK